MIIYMRETVQLIHDLAPEKLEEVLKGEQKQTESGILYIKHEE